MLGRPDDQASWSLPSWLKRVAARWMEQDRHIYSNLSAFLTNKFYQLALKEVPHLVREELTGAAPAADGSEPSGRRAPRTARRGSR